MGSRVSCNNHTDEVVMKTVSTETNDRTRSHVYMKDQFQLNFLDCDCCCDTTKKIANCDFQGINILQDLYEMVVSPEYKLNCRCSCGDDNNQRKQTIKFGLTGFPHAHLACDDSVSSSCPVSSDSRK
ncbi:unnamed protein product [Adineta ricciae]|uniref:Uncharacterized protein n=1 Tax=Adineta ricciae TaxID=249248 RepID=A0A814TNT6_ADIRI|nr:unnamed protein product [Adineta ricciae]CAF1203066.1 unnamed protein product [Adineta ricciae]